MQLRRRNARCVGGMQPRIGNDGHAQRTLLLQK
jgi:hypothetical protein